MMDLIERDYFAYDKGVKWELIGTSDKAEK